MSHTAMQFVPVNSMAKREVVAISAAFSVAELEDLREKLGKLELEEARLGSTGHCDSQTRISRIAWLSHDEASTWIFRRLMSHIQTANVFFGLRLWGIAECLQYSEYQVGGHYRWHRDNGIDVNEAPRPPRKISFSLQLSRPDEYDAGELEILDATPEAQTRDFGALILFPSYVTHRVKPVSAGLRRSLVGWACGEDFT